MNGGMIKFRPMAPSYQWEQLVGSGIGAVASLFGAGGPSKEERALMQQQANLMRQGSAASSRLTPLGTNLIRRGASALAPVQSYYGRILGGDRGAMTEALAPEIGQITEGYRSARESQAALQPRGGGRATLLSSLPYQQSRDISTLFQTARPAAAQGLTQVGQATGAMGQGTLQSAINSLYGSTAAGRDALNANMAINERRYSQSRDLGRSLFDIGQGLYGAFSGGDGSEKKASASIFTGGSKMNTSGPNTYGLKPAFGTGGR